MKLAGMFFTLSLIILCMNGCETDDACPCPCPVKQITVEHDEIGDMLSDVDLAHAFQPDEKVILKNGKAAVKLCQSGDGSFEIYKFISERFGERGIIVRYQFENYNNVCYLDEICLRNTAKVRKLNNGDALLSLLQGAGTGFYINKLFVLHIDNEGKLIPFEVKINEIFEQLKEKTELTLSLEKKVATITTQDSKGSKSLSFFLTKHLNSMVNSKEFEIGQWITEYSPNQLSYGFKAIPKVFLRVALVNEKTGAEHLLGEVSFDFEYNITGEEFSFDLSNPEIVKQF